VLSSTASSRSSRPEHELTGFTPSATTRILALLGDPVAHSLSPSFQNAALRHCGIDAVYVALRCDADAVAPLIRALCLAGGAGNVTIPHKRTAAACVQRPTAALRRTGACNTFWAEDGIVCGDNTDVAGFHQAARLLLPELRGARVLVVGAGGAAAAALCALLDARVDRVCLLNRSQQRATLLARQFDADAAVVHVMPPAPELRQQDFDLVVNATAAGISDGDPLPLDLEALGRVGAALDLVYRADGTTPWIRHARQLGVAAADGREMLLEQGSAAFQRWFGIPAPGDVMRAALPVERAG
jgi:shikimate dehydrogenase